MSESRCRYQEGYGYYLPSHLPTCRDNNCGGCEPCERDANGNPTRHCTARRSCSGHLGDDHALTCPRCVGRTRDDLSVIVQLATLMSDEAVEQGVDSEAAYLAGPAADPEAWSWRKVAAGQGRTWHASLVEEDDEHHPYLVLGRWDFMLREDYGQPTEALVTVARSADYLTGLLSTLAQDSGQDWPLFAGEIATCRARLEAVLHDSRAPEKGRPCPDCSTLEQPGPALVKRYAHHCERETCDREHDTTGASDEWRCPWDEEHRWSEADYRLRVAGDFVQHADALTAQHMHDRLGVPLGSVRGWATNGKVRKRGKDQHGRQLYDVADVARMQDAAAQRAAS